VLSTTSHAILGQLAWGEATTYELVKAMVRNMRFMWPRAESRIYEEAKRLVDAGLAEAHEGSTGRRRATAGPAGGRRGRPRAGRGHYLHRWALFNRDWARRTEAELRRWRDTEPNPAKRRRALARIEAALEGHDPV
jgi:DNA-binding PadR family transcriptional regulator